MIRVPRAPWFSGLVDDNGTGNGTVWNKGQISQQLDAIDEAFAQFDYTGVWGDVPFDPARFGAEAPLTFAPSAGQVTANRYTVIAPNTIVWNLTILGAVVGGSGSGRLVFRLPGTFRAVKTSGHPAFAMRDGATGVGAVGIVDSTADDSNVWLTPLVTGARFTPTAGLYLWLTLLIEVH
jgi:hypothetical protein